MSFYIPQMLAQTAYFTGEKTKAKWVSATCSEIPKLIWRAGLEPSSPVSIPSPSYYFMACPQLAK